MVGFADARDHTPLDQLDEGLGDHVGVYAEVAPVGEMAKHLVWDASEADLERRAVFDDACDVAGDPLCHCADRRVDVLDHWRFHNDDAVDSIDGHQAVTSRARHVRIYLRDDHASRGHRFLGDIDRDAQTAHAVVVGRRDLHKRDVDRQSTVTDEGGQLGEGDRNVIGPAFSGEGAVGGAHVEDAVSQV